MPSGWVSLEKFENAQTGLIRKTDIEHDRRRSMLEGQVQTLVSGSGDDTSEPELVCEIAKDREEDGIVLDDEDHSIRICESAAIVLDVWSGWPSLGARDHGGARLKSLSECW